MDRHILKIRQRFESLDTASLCDASPLVRAFAPGLRCLHPHLKMVGRARPISCSNDYLTVLKGLSEAQEGDVLIVDGHRQSQAIFGELLAAEAKRRGIAGAVIDGSVRDLSGMGQLDMSVYYRWSHPRAGRAEIIEPPHDVVSVCGVTVFAGDWIMGDADGVVAVSEDSIDDVLSVAEEIQKVEMKVFEAVCQGASLTEIMKFEEFRREHERDIRARIDFHLSER